MAETPKKTWKQIAKKILCNLWDMVKIIIITVALVIIVTQVFIMNAIIPTGSMIPQIQPGSVVFCSRVDYWKESPKRGDIVTFRRGNIDDKTYYTKRIVGEPGDTVEIKQGITYINGKKYDEPWLAEEPEKLDFGPFEVPEGEYFLMGDNRNHSYDCRYWEETYIPEKTIYARARIVFETDPFKIEVLHYPQTEK